MTSTTNRQLLTAAAAGLGFSLLSALPAGAHGMADGGLLSGATHPLLGLDHLLLLIGVGTVSSCIGAPVLLFALGGGLVGAVIGSLGGHLPGAEVIAALAVSVLGLLTLQLQRLQQHPSLTLVGAPVAAAVAVHALLHGQEAPSGAIGWWVGALLVSTAVVGVSFGLLRRLPLRWTMGLAAVLSLAGAALALAPLA
jgi:urease accessory protein